ncbi:hypothetical protein DMH04_24585 [Kibdelosporangium aridum]|uniref:Uncharacterized protein n=1 Tax=Kibdelosporangium aridum TaxID=2030 RepID=A0A428Z6F8_KIBAR|nr:hypothetical protein [Kibdelosporangium aridum]RSM82793.1 hypothetical protein DMH04_24585 [Kibdelosporangium aridum]
MDDFEAQLKELIARGFSFAHPRDATGEVAAVVGVRVHHGVVDVVQIYGEHDADATRIPGDELDIFFPYKVFWRSSGSSAAVVAELLALPDPEPGDVPKVNGCWVPARPGRSKWLSASA